MTTTEPDSHATMRSVAMRNISGILLGRPDSIPCVVTIAEIRDALNAELLDALRTLCRDGLLNVHLDVNKNPMFSIPSNA